MFFSSRIATSVFLSELVYRSLVQVCAGMPCAQVCLVCLPSAIFRGLCNWRSFPHSPMLWESLTMRKHSNWIPNSFPCVAFGLGAVLAHLSVQFLLCLPPHPRFLLYTQSCLKYLFSRKKSLFHICWYVVFSSNLQVLYSHIYLLKYWVFVFPFFDSLQAFQKLVHFIRTFK